MFEATVDQCRQKWGEVGYDFWEILERGYLFWLFFFSSESIFQIVVQVNRAQEKNGSLNGLKRLKWAFKTDKAARTWGQNFRENTTWALGTYSSQIIDQILICIMQRKTPRHPVGRKIKATGSIKIWENISAIIWLKRWNLKCKCHQSGQAFAKILRYHDGHTLQTRATPQQKGQNWKRPIIRKPMTRSSWLTCTLSPTRRNTTESRTFTTFYP